jgi:sugar lactone lactonase YvrE
MRSWTLPLLIGYLVISPSMARSEPVVSGCLVRVYATVPNPQSFTFAPDGTIYAGHDSHQGDTHPDPVYRIAQGGDPVSEYGTESFCDPDGVLYDPSGYATGVAGGLLVCDWDGGAGSSALRLIHPDESVTTWAVSGQAIKNPTYMVMDSNSAVWMTDDYRYQQGLLRVINGLAQVIVLGPTYGFCGIAISPAGTIYVSANTDGTNKTIREYDLDGNLLQANFATSAAYDILAFGPGGVFGTDLYAMSIGGELYRLDSAGNAVMIGNGFSQPVDLKFGPDGNMYVSEDPEGRILQVSLDDSAVPPWIGAPASDSDLLSVAPNPFRERTEIRLSLGSTQGAIAVSVFDASGRLIRNLHSGPLDPGEHKISWDGLDASGGRSTDGVYFIRAQAQGLRLESRILRLE